MSPPRLPALEARRTRRQLWNLCRDRCAPFNASTAVMRSTSANRRGHFLWPLACALLAVACGVATTARAQENGSRATPEGELQSGFGSQIEFGPSLCHSVTFVEPEDYNQRTWSGAIKRGLVVALPGKTSFCYDMQRLSLAAIWQGGFVDTEGTHLTSHKGFRPPRPTSPPLYLNLEDAGVLLEGEPLADPLTAFLGHYLFEDRAVLAFQAGDRRVWEVAGSQPATMESSNSRWFSRTFAVSSGRGRVSILLGASDSGSAQLGEQIGWIERGGVRIDFRLESRGARAKLDVVANRLYLSFAASEKEVHVTAWFRIRSGRDDAGENSAAAPSTDDDPRRMTSGGRRRWRQTFLTQGEMGTGESAYVIDELILPASPYGAWMRPSALAFFDDREAEANRMAVATIAGDIWIVTWSNSSLDRLHWQRFATGLYEPLGLLVRDGLLYVRGRDRITRLRDLNNDGEADFYENFHSQGEIGPGYHGFIFELIEDAQQNFYYVISGRKAPSVGEVVRLSADGRRWDVIATHFRHPNGMGAGNRWGWITIADNDQDKFPSGGMIVQRGARYGWNADRTGPYVYLLPPTVDSSAGSQITSDNERWGPLSGALLHCSYSHSNVSYVVFQDNGYRVDLAKGTVHGELPNGFAVKMPFQFRSGVMRGAVNPSDGQVYVAGLRGWDTNAASDRCLTRIRYTGRPAYCITAAAAVEQGIRLHFSCPLDTESVNYDNFFAERIGKGQLEVDIQDVSALDDRTVLVEFLREDLLAGGVVDRKRTDSDQRGATHFRVIDPLAIEFAISAADGTAIEDTVYCTINTLPAD